MSVSSTVRCAEWDIHYTRSGSGPPVILLHGGTPGATGAATFAENEWAIAEHFTTYVIDFPGWGCSSKNLVPAGAWRNPFAAAGAAVVAFMDALELPGTSLVGSSFGGAAALHAAMLAPDRINRLLLLAPGGGIHPARLEPTAAVRELIQYYEEDGPTFEKFERLMRHMVFDQDIVGQGWLYACFGASCDPEILRNPPLRLPPAGESPASLAVCRDPRLKDVPCPTLFIWGRDDEVQPVACLDSFQALPNQDAVLLGRCGHWPHREHSRKFNELALWFLQERMVPGSHNV